MPSPAQIVENKILGQINHLEWELQFTFEEAASLMRCATVMHNIANDPLVEPTKREARRQILNVAQHLLSATQQKKLQEIWEMLWEYRKLTGKDTNEPKTDFSWLAHAANEVEPEETPNESLTTADAEQ